MSEWKEVQLCDTCNLIAGYAFKSKDFGDYPTKVIKIADINPPFVSSDNSSGVNLLNYNVTKLKKYVVKKGDYLLAMTGATIGKLGRYISDEQVYLNQRVLRFEPHKSIDSDFLYYILCGRQFSKYIVNHIDSESAQPNISAGTIGKFLFRIPEIDTQRRIASILSSLDDKISVNNKICENLEAQAQALFKHWFIDFAPFKDGKFVESELGMIPEGWRVGTLGEYVDNLNGYSYKGNELQPSTTAMVTIKNFVRGGGFKIEGFKEIVVSKKIKEYQYISLFDVLVAHTDLTQKAEVVGNPAIILSTGDYDKLVMSMDLTKVVPKDARITTPLLHSILSTRKFKEHALGYVNGTTVLHMNKKAVPEYCFAIPKNLDILKGLTAILDNIYRMMSEIYAENLRLSTLRDTLLPRLMSGEIKL